MTTTIHYPIVDTVRTWSIPIRLGLTVEVDLDMVTYEDHSYSTVRVTGADGGAAPLTIAETAELVRTLHQALALA